MGLSAEVIYLQPKLGKYHTATAEKLARCTSLPSYREHRIDPENIHSVRIFVVISRNSGSVGLNIRQFSMKRALNEFDELKNDAEINNRALEIKKD